MTRDSIPVVLSVISLCISVIVSWNSWWRGRASLKIEQLQYSSFIKSFDGCLKTYTFESNNLSPHFHSVILIDLIITNQSSNPISILEFSTPNFPEFNSYSRTQDAFYITTGKNSRAHFGGDVPIKYLKPEITIDPYTSIRGCVFFWSGTESDLDISKPLPLKVKTSRKTFNKNIKIDSEYDSIKKRVYISKDKKGNIVEIPY